METINHLRDEGERQRTAASKACDAAQDLARCANAANARVVTAPVAYDLLGNIKMVLHHLHEVTDHMPVGLVNSLKDERIHVYDRDMGGNVREPIHQVEEAVPHLHGLTRHLLEAYQHAEAAQQAVAWQGYTEAEPVPDKVNYDNPGHDSLQAAFPQPACIVSTPVAASVLRVSPVQLDANQRTNHASGRGSGSALRET